MRWVTPKAHSTCSSAHTAKPDIRLAFLKTGALWNNRRMQPRFLALAQRIDLEADRAYGRY